MLTCAAAATAILALGAQSASAAKSFKVLDGRFEQRVDVSATYYDYDPPCYESRVYITGSTDYALQAVRGVKVKAAPSNVFGTTTLKGVQFTGAGENSLSQSSETFGPNGPPDECGFPDPPPEIANADCAPEQVSPPAKLELTEAEKAPTTESFFSKGAGLAPFGGYSDPDGSAYTCTTGSNWSHVTFPAPSDTKLKKLLKATKPLKIGGFATYSGREGLSDCFCDQIDGYNDVETDWALKLKPLGKG